MKINWPAIALKINSGNCGGSDFAQDAISAILGSDAIVGTVEHYITYMDGSELARSVLALLRPQEAMDYCMKIYREDSSPERRHAAIELLRSIADKRAFEWVPELLSDADSTIQSWGASMVDQLLFAGLVEAEDCLGLMETMKVHSNPQVRRYHDLVLDSIRSDESA